MNPAPLIALPGTLLDGRSLATLLAGRQASTMILGEAGTLDEEVDQLAARTAEPAIWLGHSLGGLDAVVIECQHGMSGQAEIPALAVIETQALTDRLAVRSFESRPLQGGQERPVVCFAGSGRSRHASHVRRARCWASYTHAKHSGRCSDRVRGISKEALVLR